MKFRCRRKINEPSGVSLVSKFKKFLRIFKNETRVDIENLDDLFDNFSANWTTGVHTMRPLHHGKLDLRDHTRPHWDR